MKEKNLIVQNSKSLTPREETKKSLSTRNKNTSIVKHQKQEKALQKTIEASKTKIAKIVTNNKLAIRNEENKMVKAESKISTNAKTKEKSTSNINNSSARFVAEKEQLIRKSTSDIKNNSTISKTKKVSKKDTLKDFTAHANEYFDLPYRYNETVVKLLAQTPKRLFVYWDISDKDRENYIKTFGDDFFNKTTPFLRVKNETYNYTFDVDINDFANSWYIDVKDDNSKYSIELFRKIKNNILENYGDNTTNNINDDSNNTQDKININLENLRNNPIFIVSSNKIDAPNGKVISTTYPREIQYRDIKTNRISYKTIEMPDEEFFKNFYKDQYFSTAENTFTSR